MKWLQVLRLILSSQKFLLLEVLEQFKWRSDFILKIAFVLKQEISRVVSAKISSVKNEVLHLKKIHSTFEGNLQFLNEILAPSFFLSFHECIFPQTP